MQWEQIWVRLHQNLNRLCFDDEKNDHNSRTYNVSSFFFLNCCQFQTYYKTRMKKRDVCECVLHFEIAHFFFSYLLNYVCVYVSEFGIHEMCVCAFIFCYLLSLRLRKQKTSKKNWIECTGLCNHFEQQWYFNYHAVGFVYVCVCVCCWCYCCCCSYSFMVLYFTQINAINAEKYKEHSSLYRLNENRQNWIWKKWRPRVRKPKEFLLRTTTKKNERKKYIEKCTYQFKWEFAVSSIIKMLLSPS